MDPITYGEPIAIRLAELRESAARERAARNFERGVPAWRLVSGRLLVSAGERLLGCAMKASGEVQPQIRVVV